MKPRADDIVVTGMGVAAAGVSSPATLYERVVRGVPVAEWVDLAGLPGPVAAVRAPDPELLAGDARLARGLDRSARLGLGAARSAAQEAHLDEVDAQRIGVMIGTGRGPLGRTLESAAAMSRGSMAPTASADSTPGSLSGIVAQLLGVGGPSATIVATCASGANAIAIGALHLLAGEADAMIVGGTDAPIVPLMVAQLSAAGVCGHSDAAESTCRPYDSTRTGLMVGEGAGALVLERASTARERGARPLATLSGWATGNDLGGRTGVTANGEGLVRVIGAALGRARLAPRDIDHVNGHGTGTRLNDAVEAVALNAVFGSGKVPPITSTKPITGHCLGATAAIEAIIAIETLRNGCLPPTANHSVLDPDIDLDVVSGSARAHRVQAVLSTSLGFWGAQAALVFTPA